MKMVYKYEIPIVDEFTIDLPWRAQILSVQVQKGAVCIWALVNPEEHQKGKRMFRLAGTGHSISTGGKDLKFIGTFQLYGGDLVFHLFEILLY